MFNNLSRITAALILALFTFPLSGKADPMLWSTSFVDFNTLDASGNPEVPLIVCSETNVACIGSYTVPGTSRSMSYEAYAESGYGILKAYASASISGDDGTPTYDYSVSRGMAAFQDVITVSGQPPGTPGSMSFTFTVTGNSYASTGNNSGSSFILDGQYVFGESSMGGVFTSPNVQFVFGQPFEISIYFLALNNIWDFSEGSYATSDFFNTALLTGIDVSDSQGQAVRDFSIQAVSGTTYGANGIIPEPASLLLLGTGLGVLGLAAFRRKRK